MADGTLSLFGHEGPISVDLFAGGGGASEGIRLAIGYAPTVAVNHDADAIAVHTANHPETVHYQESVYDVRPKAATWGRRVDLLWASPQCTHFSRARGGVPKSEQSRSLAWVVVDWAREVRPRLIFVENVEEWRTWGPLGDDGQPIVGREGETFRAFVAALEAEGYRVEHRSLSACDYGAPTTRKRLFLVARCDGLPVRWPEPTHGPGRIPYRTAAECIDWSLPIPSIFGRKKPLAEATERRIAEGIRRYVLGGRPFLVKLYGTSTAAPLDGPMPTVTGQGGHLGLVAAFLAKHNGSGETWNAAIGSGMDEPVHTVTGRDTKALCAAYLVNTRNGERKGQAPRTRSLEAPMWTATAGGSQGALVAAFLCKYYSQAHNSQSLREPLHTIPTVDRFGLVTATIDGRPYAIVDIGMRMLQPRELATAQGFPADYRLTGETSSSQTKSAQVARIGNSVCPPVARALVAANWSPPCP